MTELAVFRDTRADVASEIPKLAPELVDDPNAIRDRLLEVVASKVTQDTIINPVDLNKLERETISAFVIGEQRDYLVQAEDGQYRTAHFRNFCVSGVKRVF